MDRLHDIQRDMPRALDLVCSEGHVLQALHQDALDNAPEAGQAGDESSLLVAGIQHVTHVDSATEMLKAAQRRHEALAAGPRGTVPTADFVHVPSLEDPASLSPGAVAPDSIDLVVSSLGLHWHNNLPDLMKQVQACLKPDGVFIGAVFGGDSLFELRSSLAIAEQERKGGVGLHVSPLLNEPSLCDLLFGAGFSLVTVDSSSMVVEFDNPLRAMYHLGGMGGKRRPGARPPHRAVQGHCSGDVGRVPRAVRGARRRWHARAALHV